MRRNLYILAIAGALLVAQSAFAQALPPPIQYVVYPETPGPNESVKIEVQGVGSFLGSADITWKQDGKVVKRGIGERTYTFTTGALGQKTTVQISIDSSQGVFSKTYTFNPSKINLVWEANTTVPPLYKGKALYSPGSTYKVVAYPTVYSGKSRIAQSALSYQWSYKDNLVPNQSGLGRYTFTQTGDQLQASEEVAVDVYYGASKVGTGRVSIPASNPQILLYQREGLRGPLYDAALPDGISLNTSEITIQAEPYYFAVEAQKGGQLPFAWTLGDNETSGPDSARGIITLRQNGAGQGQALLGVSIQNLTTDQFVQTASRNLQIVFGSQGGNAFQNLFGL